ncbi:hypothetical protein B0J17DRAFT_69630 [Rhizoctonia solani]|nr:hypothetical protein B0J17DRAFT_69630 [Rhizoctonia solani]
MISPQQLDTITELLLNEKIVLSELFCAYIAGPTANYDFAGHTDALRKELCAGAGLNRVIGALLITPSTAPAMNTIARNITVRSYISEMNTLLSPAAGFHFNVANAKSSQFSQFSNAKMAKTFKRSCPSLWDLFGVLLNAASVKGAAMLANAEGDYLKKITYRDGDSPPDQTRARAPNTVIEDTAGDVQDEGWGGSSEDEDSTDEQEYNIEQPIGLTRATAKHQSTQNKNSNTPWKVCEGAGYCRQLARIHVRRLLLFNICMTSSNMRCNSLQAVVGLFVHSTNVPEKVVELLSRMGVCIAPNSINSMVGHMSTEAQRLLKEELPKLLTALGYDNLEIRFDTEQPTATNQGKLVSLATATCVPLRPGTKKEHLRWSKRLWEQSEFNLYRIRALVVGSHEVLLELFNKVSRVPLEESIESLYAWHVRKILLSDDVDTIPVDLKEKFRHEDLGLPVFRSQIEHAQTTQQPMRSMVVNLSETQANAAEIEYMLEQGGVQTEDLEEYVILCHGDLGTGKKIASLQESRSIEKTARRRLQYLVFVCGWFHTRMAMADAIWRLWIEPERPRTGHPTHPHSIFHLCALLRPREIGKMSTNPGFRRTHSIIEHLTVASIADAWGLAVKAKFNVKLNQWKPTWEDVITMSHEVVREYVASPMYRLSGRNRQSQTSNTANAVKDQSRLFNRDGLLYLATTQASRYGDVRRMEDLLLQWVYIWKYTRKYQYATHYARFLVLLDHGWPAELSNIIRNNWLANPTGKVDGFRGVDWVIERNNYMQKCLHSGSGSCRTVENLIKQSVLIEDYQMAHGIVEREFHLSEKTSWHPPPVMKTSLAIVRQYLKSQNMNSLQPGRTLLSPPTNAFAAGIQLALEKPGELGLTNEDQGEGGEDEVVGSQEIGPRDLAVDD